MQNKIKNVTLKNSLKKISAKNSYCTDKGLEQSFCACAHSAVQYQTCSYILWKSKNGKTKYSSIYPNIQFVDNYVSKFSIQCKGKGGLSLDLHRGVVTPQDNTDPAEDVLAMVILGCCLRLCSTDCMQYSTQLAS